MDTMEFTLTFIKYYWIALQFISPILLALVFCIALLGFFVGKLEGWSRIDTIYYSCITATTVGYGDFLPCRNCSKLLAILITFVGLVLTGILVAIALNALTVAFKTTDRGEMILTRYGLSLDVGTTPAGK